MSYSYVKTVFPNFKYSNVYDTNLYKNTIIENTNNTNNSAKNIAPHENNMEYFNIEQKNTTNYELPETKIETFQNNLKYYNLPSPPIHFTQQHHNPPHFIEQFEKENTQDTQHKLHNSNNHTNYTTHVLDCSSCREILMKQFNIESDRIRNEEIMELISFIIFGIFILLLLDKAK